MDVTEALLLSSMVYCKGDVCLSAAAALLWSTVDTGQRLLLVCMCLLQGRCCVQCVTLFSNLHACRRGFAVVNGFIFSAILEYLSDKSRYKAQMVRATKEVEHRWGGD
jgi:hypothetical protein